MGKYALVYHQGRKIYLGLYGTPESKAAYARLVAELQKNPTAIPLPNGEREFIGIEHEQQYFEIAHQRLIQARQRFSLF